MSFESGPPVRTKTRRGIELMARTGFVAKGVVYLVLGYFGLRAALGPEGPRSFNTALLEILRAPLGSLLLAVLALGLVWYSAWRFIEAFGDANDKGSDPKGLGARAIYFASGCVYSVLAFDAIALLLNWDNSAGDVRSIFTALLQGPVAVLAGIVLIAYGLYQFYKGAFGKMSKQLNEGEARREGGRWVIVMSRIGIAGRACVFLAVGFWLATHPSQGPAVAKGSGALGSLKLFERFPQGDAFMFAAAIALMAYGAYQLVHSRYRRINVPS
jgi:hypothetical protein